MGEQEAPSGYGQYCPIARALDVLGERWSLLILRDMLVGATRFNDIARGLPGLSRSLLSKRLGQFERAGLIDRLDGEYILSPAGRQLEPIVFGLGAWGARWSFGDPTDSMINRREALNVPDKTHGRGLEPGALHFLAGLPRIDGQQDPAHSPVLRPCAQRSKTLSRILYRYARSQLRRREARRVAKHISRRWRSTSAQ